MNPLPYAARWLIALILTAACALSPVLAEGQPGASGAQRLSLGVFAYIGIEQTREQYQPIVDDLNQRLAPTEIQLESSPSRRSTDGSGTARWIWSPPTPRIF